MTSARDIHQTTQALTVHQPWAWAVCHAGRNLENRDWRPPPYIAHRSIAIHASRRWTRHEKIEASALACRLHPEIEVPLGGEGYALGAVVAMVRVVGFVDLDRRPERGAYSFETKTSKGLVCVGGNLNPDQIEAALSSPWFEGPCAWLLGDVRVLQTPVEARGYQRLWRLPGSVALAVASQVNIG